MIEHYLGGNLCRCTGYRPIVDAACQSLKDIQGDQFTQTKTLAFETLSAMSRKDSVSETSSGFLPQSISSLNRCIRAHPQARLVAGGTDMALEVTQQLRSIQELIHLERVAELRAVTQHVAEIEIGSAVSLAQCQQLIAEHYPHSAELFDRFGSKQIRNSATIGGNIANASPVGDLPPLLIALDARLRLQTADAIRNVCVEDFFLDYKKTALGPGEFIRSIVIPKPSKQQRFSVYKVSKRYDDDISAVCMAISMNLSDGNAGTISNVRIALGGMAAIPKRATQSERAIENQEFSAQSMDKAAAGIAKDFAPISDARASSGYRLQLAQNLLRRFYLEMSQPDLSVRVTRDE